MTQGLKKKKTEAQEFSFDYPGLGPNRILVDSVVPLARNSAVSPRFPDNPPPPRGLRVLTLRQGDDPAAGESAAGGGGCGQRTCVFKVRMCISCHGQLLRWPNKTNRNPANQACLSSWAHAHKGCAALLGPPAVQSALFCLSRISGASAGEENRDRHGC